MQLTAAMLTAPFRAYLSLRRSMTVASVLALLAMFMTLNVIWGFPWSGLMGACLAMLIVGFAINRIMRPRLKVGVSLPASAVAGNPFAVNVLLANPRFFPAMNLRVGWHHEGVRDIYSRREVQGWDASPPVSVDMLRSGEQMHWNGAMQFEKRGVHSLPPFQVASTFPFHLFHHRRAVKTDTTIAITPAPAGGEDDPTARVILAAIGDWAKQLVAGAPVEYVGNREYQVGVPVRRWDFASWARLGRPIVREYQAPSIHAVTMIIDTSLDPMDSESVSRSVAKQRQQQAEAVFERLMSIAATAISEIAGRRVQLHLYLTSESEAELPGHRSDARRAKGEESMLVRLATAEPIDPRLAQERIGRAIEASRSRPVLVLSLLALQSEYRSSLAASLSANVTYLTVQPAQDSGEGHSR
jgi:uncharacterized protein (DUF58 family)